MQELMRSAKAGNLLIYPGNEDVLDRKQFQPPQNEAAPYPKRYAPAFVAARVNDSCDILIKPLRNTLNQYDHKYKQPETIRPLLGIG